MLTPEEVARQEAAKWKEGFDEEKQMKFWSRIVVVQPAFDDDEIDIDTNNGSLFLPCCWHCDVL